MVAAKVLTPVGATREDLVLRFRQETELLTRLGGQHHLVGGRPAGPALVLELGDGSLAGRLSRAPLPVRIAQIVARQLLDAVGWLHQNGVIHRDVKSSNVLMMEDGTIRLADLGVAASGDPPRGLPDGGVEEAIGTLGYAAPELIRDATTATPLVDVHAAGVVCYEMVSGVLPWVLAEGELDESLRSRIVAGEPPRPLAEVAEVPASYADAVMRAIDPEPAARPASAAELAALIARAG